MNLLHSLAGQPLAILPNALDAIVAGEFRALAPGEASSASRFAGARAYGELVRRTPKGTAVVSIVGPILSRGAVLNEHAGFATFEGLQHKIAVLARDPAVKAVVLDIESPGGAAAGMIETAGMIRKASTAKPFHAAAGGVCCSAAYALASACRAIIAAPSSIVGSIGVVAMHLDLSSALESAGVKPTIVHAGARKVDAHPFIPLSKEARNDMQAEVDRFYSLFLACIAAGRGARFSADAARKTEARTYLSADAKKIGLVDEVGTFTELLESLEQRAA